MPLDPQLGRSIAAHLSYLRDLGIFDLYRRDGGVLSQELVVEAELVLEADAVSADRLHPPMGHAVAGQAALSPQPFISGDPFISGGKEPLIPRRDSLPSQPSIGLSVPPENRAQALRAIQMEIGDCTRCPLSRGRNKIVFGDGDPNARLMFVGEGPGADEDAQGLPFVGRAGQLLNNMIAAMGLKREQVYIANIVKCRPPQNRVPEPEEANTCTPFLFQQINVIRPEVLVALGSTAAANLLGIKSSLSGLRGRVHAWRGSKLIVTYHPAYLLRDPRQKKEAWYDLQLAMAELGLPLKSP
jgi:uracil-DNA glycosylase family 4